MGILNRRFKMVNILLSLTKGETHGDYTVFVNANYWAGLGILQDLWINNNYLKLQEIRFNDNGQELILYTNIGTYSCNYVEYCNFKFVTSVYNKNGFVFGYSFDYDSTEMLCLL